MNGYMASLLVVLANCGRFILFGLVRYVWHGHQVWSLSELVGSGLVGYGQHGHRVWSCLIRSRSGWLQPTWTSGLLRLGRVWPTCTLVGSGIAQHGH